jgi:hypothetical protein
VLREHPGKRLNEAITSGPYDQREQKCFEENQAGELNVQSLTELMEWLQATSWAVYIHRTAWAFTTIELVHVFAISLVIGSIAIVDLRLLGVGSTKRPVTGLAGAVLPVTWAAFVLAVLAGSLLFISQAAAYFSNTAFRIKMLIIVLAGINMLIFELSTMRGVRDWDTRPIPPPAARLAGGLSLTCWVLVVVFGRWTGFTVMK